MKEQPLPLSLSFFICMHGALNLNHAQYCTTQPVSV